MVSGGLCTVPAWSHQQKLLLLEPRARGIFASGPERSLKVQGWAESTPEGRYENASGRSWRGRPCLASSRSLRRTACVRYKHIFHERMLQAGRVRCCRKWTIGSSATNSSISTKGQLIGQARTGQCPLGYAVGLWPCDPVPGAHPARKARSGLRKRLCWVLDYAHP